jgi:hypothetical protein
MAAILRIQQRFTKPSVRLVARVQQIYRPVGKAYNLDFKDVRFAEKHRQFMSGRWEAVVFHDLSGVGHNL